MAEAIVQQVYILRGIPGSGKSTWALEFMQTERAEGRIWYRVNRDSLRLMMHGSFWDREYEQTVKTVEESLVREYLALGFNVIIDDTNISSFQIREWKKFIRECEHPLTAEGMSDMTYQWRQEHGPFYRYQVKLFHTPIETCLLRNASRDKSVPEETVMQMHYRLEKELAREQECSG